MLVQGLQAGGLEGFRFRPDRDVRESSRGLLAAANRSLSGLVRERVEALEREDDSSFVLGPGAEVLWRGAAVARLVAGESALQPQVDVLATDLLDPPLRERVRARLAGWLDSHLRSTLPPLFALRDGTPPGVVRGLAFALVEGLGAVPPPLRGAADRGPDAGGQEGPRARTWASRSGACPCSSLRCCGPRPRGCARGSSPCGRDARPRAAPTARRPSRMTLGSPRPSTSPAATCPPAPAPSASTASSARPPSPPASPATARSAPRGTSRRFSAAPPTKRRLCSPPSATSNWTAASSADVGLRVRS